MLDGDVTRDEEDGVCAFLLFLIVVVFSLIGIIDVFCCCSFVERSDSFGASFSLSLSLSFSVGDSFEGDDSSKYTFGKVIALLLVDAAEVKKNEFTVPIPYYEIH